MIVEQMVCGEADSGADRRGDGDDPGEPDVRECQGEDGKCPRAALKQTRNS